MILKFDHIIHYIDQLDRFSFPGDVIKLHSGGYHHKYGTFNKLGYINENYGSSPKVVLAPVMKVC